MSRRHVDNLVATETLKDTDFLITEENDYLRKVSVATVKDIFKKSSSVMVSPVTYASPSKYGGSSVGTRKGMYNTVKSLFDAVAPVATLRLFILNNTNDTYRGGLVTLTATTMTVVYADDSSTETFLKSDSAALNATVVSPWGFVPNTESFTREV